VLHSASYEHRGPHRVGYKLTLVPALQTLDQHRSRRIFQHLSVPMILRQLLEEHGLPDDSFRFELTNGNYPLRPFCIQYEETDLGLLQRLCEEEGIHYHFEHHSDGHVLVFADDTLSFPQVPLTMPFRDDEADGHGRPVISELFQRHDSPLSTPRLAARNRGATDTDHGAANHVFNRPASPLPRPVYEQRHRDQLARRHLERLRCQKVQVHGQSTQRALRSAGIVQVEDHPLPGFNDQWLVTQVLHQGQQDSMLAGHSLDMPHRYRNQFTAIPWSTVFRPALKETKPSIPGYQPARVSGPTGQPAALNEHGQIQVKVWSTTDDDSEGLWVPIVVAASDARIEPSGLPLAGSDGLVSFLDSDPDRPVFCASSGQRHNPRPTRQPEPRSDTRLLFDWLINPSEY
jgi:type VI secretion system secreted protein VgrG